MFYRGRRRSYGYRSRGGYRAPYRNRYLRSYRTGRYTRFMRSRARYGRARYAIGGRRY